MSDFLTSVLPTGPVSATLVNPRIMLVYGDFKIGKSAIASWVSLNRKALWLDYEEGGPFLPGVKVDVVAKVKELNATRDPAKPVRYTTWIKRLFDDLAKEPVPRYDIILHDKVDCLEEWCEAWATHDYKNSVIGKNFEGNSVLELPDGGGYKYLRDKFLEIWNSALSAAPHHIFFATMRVNRNVGKSGNATFELKDLDLSKGIRRIVAGRADAPALLYREVDGSNWISFATSDPTSFVGNRLSRLEGRRIRLSWITHWTCCGEKLATREQKDDHVRAAHKGEEPDTLEAHIFVDWDRILPNGTGEVK